MLRADCRRVRGPDLRAKARLVEGVRQCFPLQRSPTPAPDLFAHRIRHRPGLLKERTAPVHALEGRAAAVERELQNLLPRFETEFGLLAQPDAIDEVDRGEIGAERHSARRVNDFGGTGSASQPAPQPVEIRDDGKV